MQSPWDRANLEAWGFWAQASALQRSVGSKMRPPALFVRTETFCPFLPYLSTGMFKGSLQAESCQKFPFDPSWGLGAGRSELALELG